MNDPSSVPEAPGRERPVSMALRVNRAAGGEAEVRILQRVPRSCGETEITPDYGSGVWGFESLRERSRPVAHLDRAPLSRSGGSRFDTCRADWCLDPESEGPGRDPGSSGGGTRQAPQGELIMWREHPAVNRSLRLCRFDSCLAHRAPPWQRTCRRASEARSSQFDSGRGDQRAARSTRDVRLPPEQTVASSSLAGPATVFRCG